MASEKLTRSAAQVLIEDNLSNVVDLVAFSPRENFFEVHSNEGSVSFRRVLKSSSDEIKEHFEVVEETGLNPLLNQDPTSFCSIEDQRNAGYLKRSENSYPYAFEHLAQIWDHKCAPDIFVSHTPAHNFESRGGHRGEHGSLDILQTRAPFIISGSGVANLGVLEGHGRIVDVAPTILNLLGHSKMSSVATGKTEKYLISQDGDSLDGFIESGGASHVVVFLLDGCNPNVLFEAIRRGLTPNLAGLVLNGSAFKHGIFASMPSVTLANHTSLLTGTHPGHHGVLHNAWWDKDLNEQIVTESPSTWHVSMRWLNGNVETLHEAIKRQNPDATTVSINEPADRGATYSTFDLWRRGAMSALGDLLPKDGTLPEFASENWYRENKDYSWASIADHLSMSQAIEIFSGSFDGRDFSFPELSWINFALTDAAFHAGGPDSEIGYGALIDTDKRIGRVLEALYDSKEFEKSAVLVVADHGMEETNPEVQGDWEKELTDRGFKVRDESFGFLYLDE